MDQTFFINLALNKKRFIDYVGKADEQLSTYVDGGTGR